MVSQRWAPKIGNIVVLGLQPRQARHDVVTRTPIGLVIDPIGQCCDSMVRVRTLPIDKTLTTIGLKTAVLNKIWGGISGGKATRNTKKLAAVQRETSEEQTGALADENALPRE